MADRMWWKLAAAGLIGSATCCAFENSALGQDYAPDGVRGAGYRQVEKKGKLWPPFPRSTTPKAKASDHFHYSHYWPYPHICEDRNSVRSVLDQQVRNGWVAETTLYEHHFDPVTNQLNSSGKMHLRWILTNVPTQHRAAFVQMSSQAQFDQARLANVQQTASELSRDGNVPPILLRQTLTYGTSAQELDSMRRKYIASQPMPRLPITSVTAGSGSTGEGN